jgi:hypothetical protein
MSEEEIEEPQSVPAVTIDPDLVQIKATPEEV